MKKIFTIVIALLSIAFATASTNSNPFNQKDLRLSPPPTTFDVSTVTLRGKEWRSGFAFPFVGVHIGSHQIATLDALLMTRTQRWGRTYEGFALGVPLIHVGSATFSVCGGYSADASDLRHIRNGQWGLGGKLTVRF